MYDDFPMWHQCVSMEMHIYTWNKNGPAPRPAASSQTGATGRPCPRSAPPSRWRGDSCVGQNQEPDSCIYKTERQPSNHHKQTAPAAMDGFLNDIIKDKASEYLFYHL